MFKVKDIVVKAIDSSSARTFVKRWHYSGKVCANSQVHFGAFVDNKLIGVMQYGPSTDKRRMASNMKVGMNEMLELNRMAMIDDAPKNTESRFISITLRFLKKHYPFLKLIISFADACQCGDGTIYRASGFKLIDIKKNSSLLVIPENIKHLLPPSLRNNKIVSDKSLNDHIVARKRLDNSIHATGSYLTSIVKRAGAKPLVGFQMKYVYFFDKSLEKLFNFIPFNKIPDHVKMYKGSKRVEHETNAANIQLAESGGVPTNALHPENQTVKIGKDNAKTN